jgi:hypothetical protein
MKLERCGTYHAINDVIVVGLGHIQDKGILSIAIGTIKCILLHGICYLCFLFLKY